MTKGNTDHPCSPSHTLPFPGPAEIRRQAEQMAETMEIPDPDAMTREQIRQRFHELQVKQIEAGLQNAQLRSRLEGSDDLAALLRIVTDNMMDMIALTDMEGNFTFAGKSHEILGYKLDFLIGKNVMDFVHPEDLPGVMEEFGDFLTTGHPRRVAYRYRCQDGSYLWLETVGNLIKDQNDVPEKIVFSSRDITERKQAETALRESEQRFRTIIQNLPGAVFAHDLDGRLLLVNQAASNSTGYSEQELLSMNVSELDSGDFSEDARLQLWRSMNLGESRTIQSIHTRKDGSQYPVEIHLNAIRLDNQAVILPIAIDIAERRKAETALRESEDRFQKMLSLVPDMISINDKEMNILYSNWNGFGAVAEEKRILHTKCHKTYRGYDDICPDCQAKTVLETREPFQAEAQLPDGRWFDVRVIPLLDESGDDDIFVEWVRDISSQKQAEQELRKRESLLQRIFDILPIGLWFADKNGRLLRGNPAGVKIWGAEPLVDPSGYGVFKARRYRSGEEITPETWALARTIRNGATILDELLEIDAFDGKKKIIINSTAPVFDEKGDIEGAVVLNQDVTEQQKLQAQLSQAQKMESVGRLAGGVAHDFNNKLSIINGYAEIALDLIAPSSPLHETIREIHTAGKKSADIVRQLLAFARQQTISPVLLDLNDTVAGMLKMLQRLIGENIEIEWHPGSKLWPVKIDPTQVDQIMANLAVNARDAISDVGKLTIETRNMVIDQDYCRTNVEAIPGRYVMLAVSDDGCGMEKEVQTLLFEPFFTTKTIGKGTGLGLPTIYGIVKQNKGFVNVYSEPGEGTSFKIYLPAREAGEASFSPAKESTAQIPRGTETILVVEDEKTILQMARQMLERLGYTVHTAGNPSEALQTAKKFKGAIHLLVTDVVMPEMNGRDLSSRLTRRHPGLKTLYMSGYTANVIAHHGVIDEGVQFIQKPFSLQDLATKVREVLGKE